MQNAASSSTTESRVPLQDDIYDIDEGNEADTEDNDSNNPTSIPEQKCSNTGGSFPASESQHLDSDVTPGKFLQSGWSVYTLAGAMESLNEEMNHETMYVLCKLC